MSVGVQVQGSQGDARFSRLYTDASVVEVIEALLHDRPDYGGSDGEGVLTINADDDFDTTIEID